MYLWDKPQWIYFKTNLPTRMWLKVYHHCPSCSYQIRVSVFISFWWQSNISRPSQSMLAGFFHPSHPTVDASVNKHHLNYLQLQTNLFFTIHIIQCIYKRVFFCFWVAVDHDSGCSFFVFLVVKPPMVCFANMSNYRYFREPQVFLWFIQPTYLS